MIFAFTAVSAIAPSLLLVWYFHTRDLHREPGRVVWATFGLGVASIIPVLLVDLLIHLAIRGAIENAYGAGLADAFLMAAIPEEAFKFLVVWLYSSRHKAFDEPMDGIVYGVTASLGFATLENVLYSLDGGLSTALIRALTAVPCHAFLGAIMGYYIGQARFGSPQKKAGMVARALAWPILLHGLYDFPIMALERLGVTGEGAAEPTGFQIALVAGPVLMLIVEWVWAIRLTKRLRREQKSARQQPGQTVELEEPRRTLLGWMVMVFGGLVTSAGGLIILGVVLALATGQEEDAGALILAGAIFGLLPTALGVGLFVFGKRRVFRRMVVHPRSRASYSSQSVE